MLIIKPYEWEEVECAVWSCSSGPSYGEGAGEGRGGGGSRVRIIGTDPTLTQ